MSLGCLSPDDYTIWQIRGKEGFINSLESIQWYKVSESSNYANCFTIFFINIINVLLPSQIVINEHFQVLNVSHVNGRKVLLGGWECVYLSANHFSMAWEKGIQVKFPFFVFAWHWKTDLSFAFCFSFSPNFEKRFWTSYFSFFVFTTLWKTTMNFSFRFSFNFRITLKSGYEFRFSLFVFALLWKRIWISFLVFSSLWKTDLNFVCHFCMTWKTDHCTRAVIWSPGHPLGVDRGIHEFSSPRGQSE